MKNRIYFVLLMVSFIAMINYFAFADVIVMNDGSIINGKIKDEKDHSITFKNSNGIYSINKIDINKFYSTNKYEEDLEIIKQYKSKVNEGEIEKNYLDGMKKVKKRVIKKRFKYSNLLSLSGSILFMFGDVQDVIPYGYLVNLSYMYTFDKFVKPHPKLGIFALSLDIGFIHYPHNKGVAYGPDFSLGFIWIMPIKRQKRGHIRLGLLPGMSYFYIHRKRDNFKVENLTFTFNAILGYEYTIKRAVFFIQIRLLYINDEDVLLLNAGFEAGAGVKF